MYSNREQSPTGQQNEMTPMGEVVAFLCACILTNYYEVLFKIVHAELGIWLVCMETGKILTLFFFLYPNFNTRQSQVYGYAK